MKPVADYRLEYARATLTEAEAGDDPFALFAAWFAAAEGVEPEPNAMTLATATADGQPSARIVLLKGVDPRGFSFFTNRASRKGRELAANTAAALVFFWPRLERQVRVEGVAELLSDAESDAYFTSRPAGSRLGAWASPQSEVIEGRELLEQRLTELEREYAGRDVPRPPQWGGYRVVPAVIEFWQGRPNRLHDRIRFTRAGSGWCRDRLAP